MAVCAPSVLVRSSLVQSGQNDSSRDSSRADIKGTRKLMDIKLEHTGQAWSAMNCALHIIELDI